ncbi:MAG: FAD-dependent oxidoreductase [Lentisphaeria bacterium]|nr:FAD-dependent oxidoreductase [Lentisphaeria bacterium]
MINHKETDIAVIGAGAAGLSAGAACASEGVRTLIIDREPLPGGVLLQCIHNGFGLHYFKEELTGPEFAGRMEEKARQAGAEFLMDHTVMEIRNQEDKKELVLYSAEDGVTLVHAKAVIFAAGCRERNRGNLGIPGDRVAGIFTAGLAQRLLNMDGFLPGKKAVIVGSGDIGLIMARRLSWCGIKVETVVEILPHPSGLSRNIAQCLDDFNIPLRLATAVTKIGGSDRVEYVRIAPLVNGEPDLSREETIECDTVLFSVGLIPETELIRNCGVTINPVTNGAVADGNMMTSVPGIFSCGNVLHVHDLVDFVAEESELCAKKAVQYIKGRIKGGSQIPTEAVKNLGYVIPNSALCETTRFYMRPRILCPKAVLTVRNGEEIIYQKNVLHVKPAEMITAELSGEKLQNLPEDAKLSFELEPVEVKS